MLVKIFPMSLKKYIDAPFVKDMVSDNKDCPVESHVVIEKKIVVPVIAIIEVVRPKQQENPIRKIVRPKVVNTARPRVVNTARPHPVVVNAVRANQMCGRKNNVLFTNTECLVLSPNFKLPNESQILLSVPRKNNMYSVDMKNIVPKESLTGLVAKNRALVVKPHNKTPYELFRGRTPELSFIRPFRCHVTILNTLDYLGKFDEKADKGDFVRYSINSKAFRVYNIRTRRVEENLHIEFLENKPIVTGTNSNDFTDGSLLFDSSPKISGDAGKKHDEVLDKESEALNELNYAFENLNTKYPGDPKIPDKESEALNELNYAFENLNTEYPGDPKIPGLETIATYDDYEEEADFTNLESSIHVSPTPTTRTHKNHPLKQVIRSLNTPVQTRSKLKPTNKQGFISAVYKGKTYKDLNTCLFACFLLQIEPTRVAKALSYPAWVEAMQKELLQFRLQKVWILVDFPKGKKAIGTKWVFKNKKDKRGIVIKSKSRIKEEVYVCQPPGFEDPNHPNKVYKVVKALYGLHQALRACTPVDIDKTLVKDVDGDDVDVHLYRSMIKSLMYLTASRPDIMYATCVKQGSMVGFGEMIQYNLTTGLGKVKAVTKASIRRNLKLEDSNGISNLPTTETFKQVALMGSLKQKIKVPQPSSPPHTNVADEAASTSVDVRHRGAATTITSIDVGQGSDGVIALKIDLKQTKKVYGAAYTKLIIKGRKIDEIDQDLNILLIQHDVEIQGRYDQDMEFKLDFDAAKEVSTAKKEVNIAEPVSTIGAAITTASVDVSPASPTRRVFTADDITMAETLVYIKRSAAKDKDKGIMIDSKPVQTKTKLQQEQERITQSFAEEEWKNIRARVEADEELTQRLQAEERNKYSEIDQANMLQLRGYSFDEIKTLFETTMRRVNTFVPMKSEVDRAVPEFAARSSKRGAEEELDQDSSKRQKTGENSKLAEAPRDKDANELS
nr:hypothetical protein [Tanacetum cinerariifolium]